MKNVSDSEIGWHQIFLISNNQLLYVGNEIEYI